MTRKLKCRYCDYTVPAWRTNKAGGHSSGMTQLMDHVRDNHTPTYELERILREQDELEVDYSD